MRLWILLTVLLFWTISAQATVYNATNDATLTTCNTDMVAGDICDIAGGTYGVAINPSNSGTSGNPITYRNKAGEQVFIEYTGTYVLNIGGKDYIEILATDVSTGLYFDAGIGMGAKLASDTRGGNLIISGCTGCKLAGIAHMHSNGGKPGFVITDDDGTGKPIRDLTIQDNVFYFHTDTFNGQTYNSCRDNGNGVSLYGDVARVAFINNKFKEYGPHTSVSLEQSSYVLFRGNLIRNNWTDVVDGANDTTLNSNNLLGCHIYADNPYRQGKEGSRGLAIKQGDTVLGHRLMRFDQNVYTRTGYSVDSDESPSKIYQGELSAINNLIFDEMDDGWLLSLSTGEGTYTHDQREIYYAHNSFIELDNQAFKLNQNVGAATVSTIDHFYFRNNLFYRIGTDAVNNDPYPLVFNKRGNGADGMNDVYDINAQGNAFEAGTVAYVSDHVDTTQTITELQTNFPNNFSNNYQFTVAPSFSYSITDMQGRVDNELISVDDAVLVDGSQGTEIGHHITRTTGSGTATPTIPVEYSKVFFDGWGLVDRDGNAITGDEICIEDNAGDPQCTTISSISYSAAGTPSGTITTSDNMTFPDNARVWFAFSGTAPNAGVFGTSGGTPAPDPTPTESGDPGLAETWKTEYTTTVTSVVMTPTPGVIQEGDGLVSIVAIDGNNTFESNANWDEIACTVDTGDTALDSYMCAYSRIATSSEPSSYTWNIANSGDSDASSVTTVRFTNPNSTTFIEAFSTFATTGSKVGSITLNSLSSTTAGGKILAFGLAGDDDSTLVNLPVPTDHEFLMYSKFLSGSDPSKWLTLRGAKMNNAAGGTIPASAFTVRDTNDPQGNSTARGGSIYLAIMGETSGADVTPTQFNFQDDVDVMVGTDYTDCITVSGINAPTTISVSAGTGTYNIDGSVYTADPGVVNNDQQVCAKVPSSADYNYPAEVTIDIGGVTDTYTVTTLKRRLVLFKDDYDGVGGKTKLNIEGSLLTDNVDACAGWDDHPISNPNAVKLWQATNVPIIAGVATIAQQAVSGDSAITYVDVDANNWDMDTIAANQLIYVGCWTEYQSTVGDGNNDDSCPIAYTGAEWQVGACLQSIRPMKVMAP